MHTFLQPPLHLHRTTFTEPGGRERAQHPGCLSQRFHNFPAPAHLASPQPSPLTPLNSSPLHHATSGVRMLDESPEVFFLVIVSDAQADASLPCEPQRAMTPTQPDLSVLARMISMWYGLLGDLNNHTDLGGVQQFRHNRTRPYWQE